MDTSLNGTTHAGFTLPAHTPCHDSNVVREHWRVHLASHLAGAIGRLKINQQRNQPARSPGIEPCVLHSFCTLCFSCAAMHRRHAPGTSDQQARPAFQVDVHAWQGGTLAGSSQGPLKIRKYSAGFRHLLHAALGTLPKFAFCFIRQ